MKRKSVQTNIDDFWYDDDKPIKKEILKVAVNKNSSNNNEIKKKRRKKRIFKRWFFGFVFLIFWGVFLFTGLKVIMWHLDNKNTSEAIDEFNEITDVNEIHDEGELVNEPESKESDYWYYIKFPMIDVSFDELMKKNTDTVGWINVNNTNINYPVVQTKDNDYYLNHSYDKSINEAGWVFMDFRNDKSFNNRNTIIYAHSRLDKTMFGSLSKVLKSDWYKNKDNHIIKISTPRENSLWQIFSVYKIKEETYYITTDFNSDSAYLDFLNTLKSRSKYNFDVNLSSNDNIITLSTCYSDTERTVVHAKKIKKLDRN